jgi:hypothetical protein
MAARLARSSFSFTHRSGAENPRLANRMAKNAARTRRALQRGDTKKPLQLGQNLQRPRRIGLHRWGRNLWKPKGIRHPALLSMPEWRAKSTIPLQKKRILFRLPPLAPNLRGQPPNCQASALSYTSLKLHCFARKRFPRYSSWQIADESSTTSTIRSSLDTHYFSVFA